jgi:hypothetical protein
MKLRSVAVAALVALLSGACLVRAENQEGDIPNRYGVLALAGASYSPSDINFWQAGGVAMFDYEKVWHHWAPDGLRFKVEYCLGATLDGDPRTVASLDAFALQYLDVIAGKHARPYIEAGIGGIYTDFQAEGQGSRVNFNPVLGLGVEFPLRETSSLFVSLRLHHLSNADLCDENRGVNSGVLAVGWLH